MEWNHRCRQHYLASKLGGGQRVDAVDVDVQRLALEVLPRNLQRELTEEAFNQVVTSFGTFAMVVSYRI